MDERTHEYIVTRLSRGVSPDEIAYELCETNGLNWPEAEALVQHVQSEKAPMIARRQFPLLFLLGAVVFLAGAAVLIEALWSLALVLGKINQPEFPNSGKFGLTIAVILSAPDVLARVAFGMAVIGGSIIGMKQAWYNVFYKD